MERMNRRIEKNKNRNHNGNQNEKRHRKRSRGNMKAENARISAVRLYLHYSYSKCNAVQDFLLFDNTWTVFVFI